MTKEQFLEKYGKPRTVVHCRTRELVVEFLELCEEFGIYWANGDNALSFLEHWRNNKDSTCFNLNKGRSLAFGLKGWFEYCYFDIIPFESEKEKENKMNKEERVKLVFETISKIAGFEIKPNKEFYINANEKKYVFKISESLQLHFKDNEGHYEPSLFSIVAIFNGGYDLEEIKEPLLTEEEKEFLRHFKFKALEVDLHCLYFDVSFARRAMYRDFINLKFNGLELDKEYTREELGL